MDFITVKNAIENMSEDNPLFNYKDKLLYAVNKEIKSYPTYNKEKYGESITCPLCRHYLPTNNYRNCPFCGQRINWSNY